MASEELHANYEPVIGLEVHAQLLTRSKAFSPDAARYGEPPNTLVHPVSLGHPGTLPVLNEKVVEMAIRMGLACNCTIHLYNQFARKHYFYADLPKGYQITQYDTPICTEGHLFIGSGNDRKKIGITRIHMEEDAGKSIHDQDPYYTLIDLNRAGVPLIEIVSEPDMRSPEEAYRYLSEIRRLVRYLDICDGNMEEGSLRCDANVSVRLRGSAEMGSKAEIKNMNSIRNVRRAIAYEVQRQIELLEKGEKVMQDTRSFDAAGGTTFSMRSKELAHDYRYFPEPDLPPVLLTERDVEKVRASMPPLPSEMYRMMVEDMKLPEYDAGVLTEEKEVALYFMDLAKQTSSPKTASNWVLGPVKAALNEKAIHMDEFPLKPSDIAALIRLVQEGKVSHSMAEQRIFPEMVAHPSKDPLGLAESMNLIRDVGTDVVAILVTEVLSEYAAKVEEYCAGKTGLIGLFVGEVMKRSGGKAEPKEVNRLVKEALEKRSGQ